MDVPSSDARVTLVSLEFLECFRDDDDCEFDHSGNCQAHGYSLSPGEKCPQQILKDLLAELSTGNETSGLGEVLRCRISQETLSKIDKIVAAKRGQGDRSFSRSSIVRDALAEYLDSVEAAFPEILNISIK